MSALNLLSCQLMALRQHTPLLEAGIVAYVADYPAGTYHHRTLPLAPNDLKLDLNGSIGNVPIAR